MVNSLSPRSPAVDIVDGLHQYTDVDDLGILAWFKYDPPSQAEEYDTAFLNPNQPFAPSRKVLKKAVKFMKQYDVVQTYDPHSAFFTKLLGYYIGNALVSREGNTHSSFTYKGRISNGLTNTLADRVVCVSDAVRQSFMGWEDFLIDEEDITVIYNGVDIDRVQAAEDRQPVTQDVTNTADESLLVGHAARLVEQKAQDTLIRSIARANKRSNKQIELVIAGDGPLRDELERLTRDVGMHDNIHFLGMLDRPDVYKMMSEVDIYAMPSRWEGFCMAVLQSMAAGTPCILSDIPSFQEFSDVAMFADADDVEGLADLFISVCENSEQRQKKARQGFELVRERYSMAQTAQQYADLYRSILR